MNWKTKKAIEAGWDLTGYWAFMGLVSGVLLFLYNYSKSPVSWLVIPALIGVGSLIGFFFGFVLEVARKEKPRVSYTPGSAYNPHPRDSHLWYQHELLMEAERSRAEGFHRR